jgi:ribosomal protein L37E
LVASIFERPKQCRRCGNNRWRRQPRNGKEYCVACDRARSAKRRSAHGGAQGIYDKTGARARSNGTEFTLVVDDVIAVMPADGLCPVLGIELRKSGRFAATDASPSLDRIDSTKGYVPGNIAVISMRANSIKNTGSALEHEKIAAWMRSRGVE